MLELERYSWLHHKPWPQTCASCENDIDVVGATMYDGETAGQHIEVATLFERTESTL